MDTDDVNNINDLTYEFGAKDIHLKPGLDKYGGVISCQRELNIL
jgi:hypothetical protein